MHDGGFPVPQICAGHCCTGSVPLICAVACSSPDVARFPPEEEVDTYPKTAFPSFSRNGNASSLCVVPSSRKSMSSLFSIFSPAQNPGQAGDHDWLVIVNEVVGGLSAGTSDQRGSASGHRCGLDTTIIVPASSCPSRFHCYRFCQLNLSVFTYLQTSPTKGALINFKDVHQEQSKHQKLRKAGVHLSQVDLQQGCSLAGGDLADGSDSAN